MTSWCRKLALVLALAVMPLQGLAATLSILLCHTDARAQSLGAAADRDGAHDHGMGADAHHGGTGEERGGVPYFHLCCNVAASVASIVTVPAALPSGSVLALGPDLPHEFYIPDRPQRPPLA